MKIPFFPPIAPGDPSSIINLALHELGLTEDFLVRALMAAHGEPKFNAGELDFWKMGCFEWIWVCEKLHIPVDSISIGYSRMTHRAWVGQAILDGAFVLPSTERVRAFFREYVTLQRQSYCSEKEHYGAELRRKIVLKRFEERRIRRQLRRTNLRLGKPVRERLEKIFTHSAIGAPLVFQRRKKHTRKTSGVLPGLTKNHVTSVMASEPELSDSFPKA